MPGRVQRRGRKAEEGRGPRDLRATATGREAIAKANESTAKANALCPRQACRRRDRDPAGAGGATPRRPMPTVSHLGEPGHDHGGPVRDPDVVVDECLQRLDRGGCRRWIPTGPGRSAPTRTTEYRIAVVGEGGSRDASTTVTVNQGRRSAEPPRQFRLQQVDGEKAGRCRSAEGRRLRQEILGLQGFPRRLYGQHRQRHVQPGSSERRAAAVKDYLVAHGSTARGSRPRGTGKPTPLRTTPRRRAGSRTGGSRSCPLRVTTRRR